MQALVQGETFLADGRVLALWADLTGDAFPSRSSLYNPQTDTWTELAPPWDFQSYPGFLSVVALPDGSALAVLSKTDDQAGATTQSALFDPVEGAWLAPVDVPIDDPISARNGVLLSDGRVLMFGVAVASTYFFDPATGSWAAGPNLPFDDLSSPGWTVDRGAAVLDDGSVLALSAQGRSARLPPGGAAWLRSDRAAVGDNAYVVAIPGGAVALGGTTWSRGDIHTHPDSRVALYRSDTGTWSSGPDAPPWDSGVPTPGSAPAGVVLDDGRVLIAGGWGGGTDYSCMDGAAILDVDALAWQSIEQMPACLGSGIGQQRADGTVVIVGEGSVNSGDVYTGIGIQVLSYQP